MRKTEQVYAGTFFSMQNVSEGTSHELFITCPVAEEEDPYAADRRLDAFNEQFEHAWLGLEAQGWKNIVFAEVLPHPFLPTV